jgi:hypothetical protein
MNFISDVCPTPQVVKNHAIHSIKAPAHIHAKKKSHQISHHRSAETLLSSQTSRVITPVPPGLSVEYCKAYIFVAER